MESTVFTNLKGSEGALTFNFFCESLITSLHTLTHIMEDEGLTVPDNLSDVADALSEMGGHLMDDYARGELDVDRFKNEILDIMCTSPVFDDFINHKDNNSTKPELRHNIKPLRHPYVFSLSLSPER